MNSLIRATIRFGQRPIKNIVSINKFKLAQPVIFNRWAHNTHLTYDFARERIMLVLRLFDKIDGEKLTLQSNFIKDMGLDSLDHVEIVMMLEDEFNFEIPEKDAERFLTPADIVRYITDKEEAYEALQTMHHDHDHDHDHHPSGHHTNHGHELLHESGSQLNTVQKRGICTSSRLRKFYPGHDHPDTSFECVEKEVNIEDIQKRVLTVCSKYDKIETSKLSLESHFVNDLGLDSLDHVEIMMELEDEFGLEIPDQDAEKLMRPMEIAKYIFHKEEKRSIEYHDDMV